MNLAETLKQEQRDNFYKIKDEIAKLLTEKIRKGEIGITIAFEYHDPEGTVNYHKYLREWWSVSTKHKIPLIEYLKREGFVVKKGDLYCDNIEVTL